ncbi:MAG: response regulator transcription factor [Rhizobium sp.]|nr:response regulator transcription factor [Rhizobium sp.]
MADLIVVDDDAGLSAMLADYLSIAGHEVRVAADAAALDRLIGEAEPELLILDVSLPGEDGFSIARRVRQKLDVGVIMLTGSIDLVDRVVGLEMGADDYVTKPFSLTEISARIEAILRRRRTNHPQIEPFGPFSLDLKRWILLDGSGEKIPLFPTEIDLVAAFVTNPGKLMSRDDLLRLAPGNAADPIDRSIDKRVERLRRKLDKHGLDTDLIETVRSDGYIYKGPPARN